MPMTSQEVAELSRLLDEALELAPAQRETWLDALGFARPAVGQRLREMLEAATGGAPLPPLPRLEVDDEAVAASGERVGPYRLLREIGRGGMGSVWLAERADGAFKRRVALKLPRLAWAAGLARRMAREREIGALLEHPHIARLYDAGVDEHGRPYIAMEYVDGQPIDAYCRDRALDLRARLRLFLQVVQAVAYAHGRLVLHRDLKPSNVLVDADGQAHLLDFGIAKLLDEAVAEGTQLTQEQGRALTLSYAAPEQITGRPLGVTADVYSLGVMLFELLTGALPYAVKRNTRGALEDAILAGDAPLASSRAGDPRSARALRGDLDAIVQNALRPDRQQRYQSAAELASDVQNYLDAKPVQAQADSAVYRLRKFVARNALPVVAGCAVVLALAVGLGATLWQAEQARRQAEQARQQAERATALNEFVLSLIRQFDPRAAQTSKAADLALLASIEKRIDAEFKGSPDQLLQLRVTVGDAYQARGQHAAARRVYRRAIADAETALPADHLGLLKVRVASANVEVGDDAAVKSIGSTIDLLRQAGPAGIETLVDALLARVEAARSIGRLPGMTWDSLYADSREALDLAVRHFGPGSARHLAAAQNLHVNLVGDAGSRRPRGDRVSEALEALEAALTAARANPAIQESHPDLLQAQAGYGLAVCAFRDYEEGLRVLRNTVARVREHHSDSRALERALAFLSRCLLDHRDPEGVWATMETYEIVTRRDEPSPWLLARIAASLARIHCDAWRGAECADFTAKALAHADAMPAGEVRASILAFMRPPQVNALILHGKTGEAAALASRFLLEPFCCEGSLNSARAWALYLDGRFEEASQAMDKVFAMFRAKGLPPGGGGWMLVQRGVLELELQRPAQALASIEQGLPDFRKDPSWDVDWGVMHLAHGRALLANGHAVEALEALRKAYGFWLGHDAKSVWAAEAEYWFGQAWLANGDVKRGRWMVAESRRALAASPFRLHRQLASASGVH